MNGAEENRRSSKVRSPGGVDRDIAVFAFFLFLSFIFWYLNGLSKIIDNTVKYPVRYINPPRERVLAGELPSRLEMDLRGPGYSILKIRLSGSRAPVVIDMSKAGLRPVRRGQQSGPQYLLTEDLKEMISTQLRADFSIITIRPDTLYFVFDRLLSKKVPVVADIEVQTDKEFFVKGIPHVTPDSVVITGPRPVIDTIDAVKTRPRKFAGVSESFSKNMMLAGSRDFSISERRVNVKVDVEQYTEARLLLPVRLINKPDSIDVKLFPDEITVRALIAVSDYQAIFDSNIQAVIDLSLLRSGSIEKLPVSVINVPSYAQSVMFTPQELDYLIEAAIK